MDREKLARESAALTEELALYARSPAPFPVMEGAVLARIAYCDARIAEIAKKLEQ